MTRSRSPRGAWVIVVALFAVACSGGADRSAAGVDETPAASATADADADHGPDHDPTHQDQHDEGHDDDDGHGGDDDEAAPAGLGGLTTEETLARFATIDPARLANAHDHGDDPDQRHRETNHPNGIDPERIVIPAIDVDADVIDLGLNDDGTMEVPSDFAQTGWFKPGVPPGRVGPAVIAGHVDSRSGPAVFFRLTELEVGDEIHVLDEGEQVTFVVREMEQHAKDAFPTEKVYSGTDGPELRLVTCGGVFDQGERSYRDNIIVYAERVDV